MLDLMRTDAPAWFSVEEVALAADVPIEGVWRLIEKGQAAVHEPKRLMSAADAVHLVRVLEGTEPESANRFPFNLCFLKGSLHSIDSPKEIDGGWPGFTDNFGNIIKLFF